MTDIRKEAEKTVVEVSVLGIQWFAIREESTNQSLMKQSIKLVKNSVNEHRLLHAIVSAEHIEDLAKAIREADEFLKNEKNEAN